VERCMERSQMTHWICACHSGSRRQDSIWNIMQYILPTHTTKSLWGFDDFLSFYVSYDIGRHFYTLCKYKYCVGWERDQISGNELFYPTPLIYSNTVPLSLAMCLEPRSLAHEATWTQSHLHYACISIMMCLWGTANSSSSVKDTASSFS
jgi:hypothetical protein